MTARTASPLPPAAAPAPPPDRNAGGAGAPTLARDAAGDLLALQHHSQQELIASSLELEELAHRLAASLSLLNATLESTPDAIVAVDLSGKVAIYNSKFAEMWQMPRALLERGDDVALNSHIAARITNPEQLWLRVSEQCTRPELTPIDTFELTDGRIVERHASPQWIDDRCAGVVVNWRDVTARKRHEELVWQHANYDALTGLPNRRLFQERLERELKQALRARQRLAVLFIDLDNFKAVNDAFGHAVGDLLLGETARRLQACVRESDTVARLGGDEFTVLIRDIADSAAVQRVAEAIVQSLREPLGLQGEVAEACASIGVTFFPDDAETPEALIRNADQAMYAAKRAGRGRVHYFAPAPQSP